MLVYILNLCYQRPYEKVYSFILTLMVELSILVAYVAAAVLAYMDKTQSASPSQRLSIGQYIVWGAMGVMYISQFTMIVPLVILIGKYVMKKFKNYGKGEIEGIKDNVVELQLPNKKI